MHRLVLVSILAGFGCTSSEGDDGDDTGPAPDAAPPGPACGDGTCNPGETSTSCPADCPASCGNGTCEPAESAASCPGDCDPTACVSPPDPCTGEDLCLDGHCVSAFGRLYTVRVLAAVVPEANASGGSWDPFGGLPDPYVDVTINTTPSATPAIADTLVPAWDHDLPPIVIPGGTAFSLVVYDDDPIDGDDPMWGCEITPLTADFLRDGMTCSSSAFPGSYVDLRFTPN